MAAGGGIVCPQCGAENAEGEQRCSQCGALLPAYQRPRTLLTRAAPTDMTSSLVLSALLFVLLMLCGTVGYFGYRVFRPPSTPPAVALASPTLSLPTPTPAWEFPTPAEPSPTGVPPLPTPSLTRPMPLALDYQVWRVRYGLHPDSSWIVLDLEPNPGGQGRRPSYNILQSTDQLLLIGLDMTASQPSLTPENGPDPERDPLVKQVEVTGSENSRAELRVELKSPLGTVEGIPLRSGLTYDRLVFKLFLPATPTPSPTAP